MLIQMSGAPGAGKSTIAAAIGTAIGASVLDHDTVKTALLDAGVDVETAGTASYTALLAVARDLVKTGVTVVVDSPCFYDQLLQEGRAIAAESAVPYAYVECVTDDLDELDRRLRARETRRSQRRAVDLLAVDATHDRGPDGRTVYRTWIDHMVRPQTAWLRLDTARPLEVCVRETLEYLASGR